MNLICFAAICLIQSGHIVNCNSYHRGSAEEVKTKVDKLITRGQVLVSECVKPGQSPELTWFRDAFKKEEK